MGIARAGIFSRSSGGGGSGGFDVSGSGGFAFLFASGFGFGGFLAEDGGVWQQGRVYPFASFI